MKWGNTFQYAGYYAHQWSGLNLTWYRGYDPVIGRWQSRDPLKNAERTQGMNLYAYVKCRPINDIDPRGLFNLGKLGPIIPVPDPIWDNLNPPSLGSPKFPGRCSLITSYLLGTCPSLRVCVWSCVAAFTEGMPPPAPYQTTTAGTADKPCKSPLY
jgi:RHS repeat-associated protein